MDQPAAAKKKPIIFLTIAALLIGIVLGAAGYSAWERQQQEPVFSFDPSDIKLISIHVWYVPGEKGDFITLIDQDGIDRVVGLLNGLRCPPAEELTEHIGLDTLVLRTAGGDNTVLYFDTYSNGRPDAIYVEDPGGGFARYEAAPGYFRELTEMKSSDPPKTEPKYPGPTAQPKQP